MIRVHLAGPHARRTPLSYPALWPLFAARLVREPDPARADLVVFAHPQDIATPDRAVVAAWRQRRMPVLLLSEEPFWDSLFSPDPLARDLLLDTDAGLLPVRQLNHATTAIFRFQRIPYYLLTDHGYLPAYAARFRRNARIGAAAWQAEFAARPLDAAFMAERRPERFHDVSFPAAGIVGLCAWRTDLALAMPGRVARLGASWQGGPTRFELANWHLDKLMRQDRQARIFSAVENTHQPDYVSEKLFDAFALGSRPAYWAAPGHGAHRLDLPPAAWANLHGLTPAAAAARLADLPWDRGFFEAFRAAQALLETLVADLAAAVAERERLAGAVLRELEIELSRG